MAITADTLVTKYTLDAKGYQKGADDVVKATQKTTQHIHGFQAAMKGGAHGAHGFGDAVRFATAELDSSTPILGEVVSIVKAIGIALAGATVAAIGFSAAAMAQAAEFDSLRLGLSAYTKDADELARVWGRLREVSRLPGLGFEEAVRGSVRLQAAGFDARLAERALLGFGNALAAVGGGKAELDGVILALTQIASKSQVSAEEINQIAERVPQIRQIMLGAFGTANTERLAQLGIAPQQFILRIIDELEKLKKVQGGVRNSFENFTDAIKIAMSEIGTELNRVLIPQLDKITNFVDYLSASGVLKGIAEQFARIIGGGPMEGAFDSLVNLLGALNHSLQGITSFITAGEGLGDTLVRAGAVFIAAFERLPDIIALAMKALRQMADFLRGFINSIIDAINAVLRKFIGEGIEISILGKKVGQIGGGGSFQAIPKVEEFQFSPGLQRQGDALAGGILGRAKEIYEGFTKFSPTDSVSGDPSKGGFRNAMEDQANLLKQIAYNTEPLRMDFGKHVFGGGDIGRLGVTAVEMGGIRAGRQPREVRVKVEGEGAMAKAVMDVLTELRRNGYVLVAGA